MCKMTKSTFFVFELILNANCIRAERYTEQRSQRFFEFLEYEYAPHRQTQNKTYLTKRLNVVVLLYMYLLYSYIKEPKLARVILAYTLCIPIVFCIHVNEANYEL